MLLRISCEADYRALCDLFCIREKGLAWIDVLLFGNTSSESNGDHFLANVLLYFHDFEIFQRIYILFAFALLAFRKNFPMKSGECLSCYVNK